MYGKWAYVQDRGIFHLELNSRQRVLIGILDSSLRGTGKTKKAEYVRGDQHNTFIIFQDRNNKTMT
jgi:hypothetical protein